MRGYAVAFALPVVLWGTVSAAPMEVGELVLPARPPAETMAEKLLLKEQAVKVVEELELAFPKAARVKIKKETLCPPRKPPKHTEYADIAYALQEVSAHFLCDISREVAPAQNERTASSYNGGSVHVVSYNPEGTVTSGYVKQLTGVPVMTLAGEMGLEFLPIFYGYTGLGQKLASGTNIILAGSEWEVLDLTPERLVIRFFGGPFPSTILEFDRRLGGSLVRWETWKGWGTGEAVKTAALKRYELTQLEGKWLPRRYDFVGLPKPTFELQYEYEWLDISLDPAPENFLVQIPPNVQLYDNTTVAARAQAQKKQISKRWTDIKISFWGWFD
jgi:hypothetical protein